MHILKVGFNYKSAPVEIREKLTFSEHDVDNAMLLLNTQKSILENVIVSTCNRTEIYAVVDQVHTGRYYIKQFLADWFQLDKSEFSSYLRIVESDSAIEHLFKVAAGLDSMVLGETQILGQVKQAFLTAQRMKTTGTILNELFKQAITFAKKAHSNTSIGEHAVSISYAAVELAKKIFGDLQNKHIVIFGAGKMGELAVKNLHGSGATKITMINRTFEKAVELAGKFGARAEHSENLVEVMQDADILISSTGSDSIVITKDMFEPIQKKRKGSPLFLVDIAVPRDIDPAISKFDSIFLYDIDDLQDIVDQNLDSRKQAAETIEIMVEAEIVQFQDWLQTLGVVPVISALRQKALAIQAETMESIERKMPNLTVREKKVLNKHTKSIVNQLLKEPVTQAKELAVGKDSDEKLELFIDIFGIKDEVEVEVDKQSIKNNTSSKSKADDKESFPLVEKLSAN